MPSLSPTSRHGVALAVLVSSLLAFWVVLVPDALAPVTFALSVAAIVAIGAITLNTYRDGQPTGSMAQLLHETEVGRRKE